MSINSKLIEGKLDRQKIDYSCETYHEIERYLKAEVDMLRKQNDDQPDEFATARLRGRIAENRSLLSKLNPNIPTTEKMHSR